MLRALFIVFAVQILQLFLVKAFTKLSDDSIKAIPNPGDDFDIKNGKLLAPILQPRVPGTPGSAAVLKHLADFFRDELPSWTVTFQNSTSKVPPSDKEVPFVNMIVTKDPPWTSPGEVGYLTLVAHYDSRIKPVGFIGAIDSAAPCAMLMHAARSLDKALTKKWASMGGMGTKTEEYDSGLEEHKGLQIMFLDGEEAFVDWTEEDSIYGAKSLAAEMEATIHPALSTYHNAISAISLFLLLDLLGSPNPSVPSYYKITHWAYRKMTTLADRLQSLSKSESKDILSWFPEYDKGDDQWIGGYIGDDHTPFMARGVEILHVIPSPFPMGIWHTSNDDGEHLDIPTCKDWAVLVTAFAAEWMDLEGFFETNFKQVKEVHRKRTTTSKTEL